MGGRSGDEFRVASSGQKGADGIADGPLGDTRADLSDPARGLQPWQRTGAGWWIIGTGTLQGVRAIDPGPSDRNQNFAGRRRRARLVAQCQNLWPAGFRYLDGAHRCAHVGWSLGI